MSHLTSPTLRAGPLPLPRCAAERTEESTRVHESPLGSGPVGCRWHRHFRPGVHESGHPGPLEKHPHCVEQAGDSGHGATGERQNDGKKQQEKRDFAHHAASLRAVVSTTY
jgi:hypothetical protein